MPSTLDLRGARPLIVAATQSPPSLPPGPRRSAPLSSTSTRSPSDRATGRLGSSTAVASFWARDATASAAVPAAATLAAAVALASRATLTAAAHWLPLCVFSFLFLVWRLKSVPSSMSSSSEATLSSVALRWRWPCFSGEADAEDDKEAEPGADLASLPGELVSLEAEECTDEKNPRRSPAAADADDKDEYEDE